MDRFARLQLTFMFLSVFPTRVVGEKRSNRSTGELSACATTEIIWTDIEN